MINAQFTFISFIVLIKLRGHAGEFHLNLLLMPSVVASTYKHNKKHDKWQILKVTVKLHILLFRQKECCSIWFKIDAIRWRSTYAVTLCPTSTHTDAGYS